MEMEDDKSAVFKVVAVGREPSPEPHNFLFACDAQNCLHEVLSAATHQESLEAIDPNPVEKYQNCGIDFSLEHERIGRLYDFLTSQVIECEECREWRSPLVIPSKTQVSVRKERTGISLRVPKHFTVFVVCTCKTNPSARMEKTGYRIRLFDLNARSISIINRLLFPDEALSLAPPPLACNNNNGIAECSCVANRIFLS
ncbi:hypothetical protein PMAYCL1PPCAC_11992 [Pristionchus mayeri]|uniref:Uncharacterized protein n=1 Tax=Pristionchus mayeri TaxID=1317129 RepID=A0AAN4ZI74_9BILA|nr:hypothetical protein PMAYCL1PPCAC_11992 [Pristionchus mayeri]